jgi:hypothetical protein
MGERADVNDQFFYCNSEPERADKPSMGISSGKPIRARTPIPLRKRGWPVFGPSPV